MSPTEWYIVVDINSPFYGWVIKILSETKIKERHIRFMCASKYFTCEVRPNTESQTYFYLTFNSNQLEELSAWEATQAEEARSRIEYEEEEAEAELTQFVDRIS